MVVVVVVLVGAMVEREERLLDSKAEEVVVAAVEAVVLDEALVVVVAEVEEKVVCFSSDLLVSLVLCWESGCIFSCEKEIVISTVIFQNNGIIKISQGSNSGVGKYK